MAFLNWLFSVIVGSFVGWVAGNLWRVLWFITFGWLFGLLGIMLDNDSMIRLSGWKTDRSNDRSKGKRKRKRKRKGGR